jgi:hypothetical protein
MVAGPQLLSAIFLATTEQWRANSLAYVAGATLSISLVVATAYFLGGGVRDQTGSTGALDAIVLGLLLLAMVRVYLKREKSAPPAWMGKLATASPRYSFRLGFVLLGFFPTDIITSVSVGSYLATNEAPLTDALGFLAVTLALLAFPSLTVLTFGKRAEAFLPKARQWMDDNAWIVNEVVLGFFVVLVGSNFL